MTADKSQATFDQFANAPPERSGVDNSSERSSTMFRCSKCGILHEDEHRIDRHIINQHSTARHEFTRQHAIERYKEEIDR